MAATEVTPNSRDAAPQNWRLERTWPFFDNGGVQMTGDTFVAFLGLLKAGHAAQPQCYADDYPQD